MGWHTVMEFSPSLIGCMITAANHSYRMIEKSGECVINIPTADMLETVIRIGNTTGGEIDKFAEFNLTAAPGDIVKAPLIEESYASFECRLANRRMLKRYNFFIFEVVKAHVAARPRYPETVHYRGEGIFMISGKNVAFPKKFKPGML